MPIGLEQLNQTSLNTYLATDEELAQLTGVTKSTILGKMGSLTDAELKTLGVDTEVSSKVDQLFQSVSSGKADLETAIADKGYQVSKASDVATFAELSSAITNMKQITVTGTFVNGGAEVPTSSYLGFAGGINLVDIGIKNPTSIIIAIDSPTHYFHITNGANRSYLTASAIWETSNVNMGFIGNVQYQSSTAATASTYIEFKINSMQLSDSYLSLILRLTKTTGAAVFGANGSTSPGIGTVQFRYMITGTPRNA